MNSVNLFLKTEIEETGWLSAIGNFGLTPYRYLFNGKTVKIEQDKVHHVSSFHLRGAAHQSKTKADLCSSETAFYKLILAIVFLVPGLILAVCKAVSYLFEEVREKNALALKHFTPIHLKIGTDKCLARKEQELEEALAEQLKKPVRKIVSIIVYGNKNLRLIRDPGFLQFNPEKILLVGVKMQEKLYDFEIEGSLKNKLETSKKWKIADPSIDSVDAALAEPNPPREDGKTFHMFYQIKA